MSREIYNVKDGEDATAWLSAVDALFDKDANLTEVELRLMTRSRVAQWQDIFEAQVPKECVNGDTNTGLSVTICRLGGAFSLRKAADDGPRYYIIVDDSRWAEVRQVVKRRVYFYSDDNAAGRLIYGECNFSPAEVAVKTLPEGAAQSLGDDDWLIIASPHTVCRERYNEVPRAVNIVAQESRGSPYPPEFERDLRVNWIPSGEKGARKLGEHLQAKVAPSQPPDGTINAQEPAGVQKAQLHGAPGSGPRAVVPALKAAKRSGRWLVALCILSPIVVLAFIAAYYLLPYRNLLRDSMTPPTPVTTVSNAPDAGAAIERTDAGRAETLSCRPVTDRQWNALRSLNTYEIRTSDRAPGVFTRGSRQRLESLFGDRVEAGRPTLVVIGSTTCGPCMEELPLLGADARARQNDPNGPQILALLLEDGWNDRTDQVPSMLTATAQQITWSGLRTLAVGAGPELDHERLLGDHPTVPAFLYVERDGSPRKICYGSMIRFSPEGEEYTRWLHRMSLRIPE